jgi:hypothetical protein
MRTVRAAIAVLAYAFAANASADESKISVGAIDAVLTTPAGVEKPPVALLIAGSGSTDHDGNGPQMKPATLKKLRSAGGAQHRNIALRQARRRRLEGRSSASRRIFVSKTM